MPNSQDFKAVHRILDHVWSIVRTFGFPFGSKQIDDEFGGVISVFSPDGSGSSLFEVRFKMVAGVTHAGIIEPGELIYQRVFPTKVHDGEIHHIENRSFRFASDDQDKCGRFLNAINDACALRGSILPPKPVDRRLEDALRAGIEAHGSDAAAIIVEALRRLGSFDETAIVEAVSSTLPGMPKRP